MHLARWDFDFAASTWQDASGISLRTNNFIWRRTQSIKSFHLIGRNGKVLRGPTQSEAWSQLVHLAKFVNWQALGGIRRNAHWLGMNHVLIQRASANEGKSTEIRMQKSEKANDSRFAGGNC